MPIQAQEIMALIRQRIEGLEPKLETVEVGTVYFSGDGIARVHGLENAMAEVRLGET